MVGHTESPIVSHLDDVHSHTGGKLHLLHIHLFFDHFDSISFHTTSVEQVAADADENYGEYYVDNHEDADEDSQNHIGLFLAHLFLVGRVAVIS